MRRVAAERAVGSAEMAQYATDYEAKEARIELQEYEEECARRDEFDLEMADNEKKWEQIKQGIADNNACHTPDDPESVLGT